jgi:hypothetical protein
VRAFLPLLLVAAVAGAFVPPPRARAEDAPVVPAPPAPEGPSDADEPPSEAPPSEAPAKTLPAPAWRDVAGLERRLVAAVAAVEVACGAPFATPPTVRVSTAAEVTEVLLALEAQLGLEPRSERAAVRTVAGALFAFTDYVHGTIHVVPDNVERMAAERRAPELVSADVLQVVLVHEAVHALDWARWGWIAHRKTLKGGDALQAFSAVAEGHAQLVAEDVATAQGRRAAFAAMTQAIVAMPDGLSPAARAMAQAAVAEAAFGYVVGHRFLRAVREAKGAAGVDEVLRAPPTETRVIEDPRRYLGLVPADAGPTVDLDEVMKVFEPLVADPRWRTQRDRARHAALASQGARLPEARRANFLAGYEDGRLVAAGLARGAQVLVIVLRFATPDDAAAFVRDDRDLGKIGEEEATKSGLTVEVSAYLDGAGTDGALPGYRYAKKLTVSGGETLIVGGDTQAGTCVASVIAINAPWVTKEMLAATADRFALAVRDPAAARALPPLPVVAVPPADQPSPGK